MAKKITRVLLVEDNPGDVRLVELALQSARADGVRWSTVARLSQALEHVRTQGTDVALVDLSLPDSSGASTVARLHQAAPELPIVVMTATEDGHLEGQLRESGAVEVLQKGPLSHEQILDVLATATEKGRGRSDAPTGAAASPSTGSPSSASPPARAVDPSALREIWKLAPSGEGAALIRQVAAEFFKQGAELLHDLGTATKRGQPAEVRAFAHTLRSLCLQVGATKLARTAAELERQGAAGDVRSSERVVGKATQEFSEAKVALEALIQRL